MKTPLTLTDEKVLEQARSTLRAHLDLKADGYRCETEDLFNVLLAVAAEKATIEAVCAELAGTPEPETIRRYINEQICVEELPHLETALNQALLADIPPSGLAAAPRCSHGFP